MTATSQASPPTTAARARRTPRVVGLLAAALLVAAGSYLGPTIVGGLDGDGNASIDAPRVVIPVLGGAAGPADGAAGDGRLPLAERIALWTTRVQEQPSDYLSFVQLAVAWSEQGRLRVDLDAFARATAAIEKALAIAPADPSATAVRASIRYATHDFSGAESDARAALGALPNDPSAIAILGDSLLELGRIDEAAAIYERLGEIAGGPALDIRNARLAFVRGDLGAALDLARKALIAASGGGVAGAATTDMTALGFYSFALGEYARLAGDAVLAEEQFHAALEMRPDDLSALLGLARVQAFNGDLDASIDTLGSAVAIAPTPEAEALLGDLLAVRISDGARTLSEQAADRAASETAYGTVGLTRTLSALGGSVYDRQLILFDLDHVNGGSGGAALDAARAALENRPDAAGHDLVAWALHRRGRDTEAWAASQIARAAGAADARTLFHAGAIAAALGDGAVAHDLLVQALQLGPALDPLERAEATAILPRLDAPAPPRRPGERAAALSGRIGSPRRRAASSVPRSFSERSPAVSYAPFAPQRGARAASSRDRPVPPQGPHDHLRLRLARQLCHERNGRIGLDDPPEPVPDQAQVGLADRRRSGATGALARPVNSSGGVPRGADLGPTRP